MARPKVVADIVTEAKTKKEREVIERIPSGSTLLDEVFGGGHPIGKVVNLVGDNSSGKTLFACEMITHARKKLGKKLRWRYDDCEAGFSFDTKSMYGFDIIPMDKDGVPVNKPSETVEEFEVNLNKEIDALAAGEYLIYVVDSLDSLSSKDELKNSRARRKAVEDEEEVKGSYGMQKQKFLSEFFRISANKIKRANCLLLIISQVRTNISPFPGPKYSRSGGKALDFYAAIICWLSEVEKHRTLNRVTGITVKARTSKNKVGLPFRECFVDIIFDYGFDDITSNLCFLNDARTPQGKMKKGEKFVFDGQTMPLKKLVKWVEENDKEDELKAATIAAWRKIDESISSADRKKRF